ncbi:DUF2628 domain-containing protein [Streptococcus loxodontisalivarius]|uniref:DUF2628 domain-containing protein n=1 Tax=Streptococcus loxodontisalivarius TaxID=1349415 RepID=A0ABS2PUL1_9STRE|nr:DUF2628 domain-containing protein [Streptococcus loxodontisalivarius]MBM7643742.1 hypothetical protein [Streptococcus loxodontisalivarius]
MKVNLKNPETNQTKSVKVGFSWTTFFFGFFVPLFRADWKWFGIMLGTSLLVGIIFTVLNASGGSWAVSVGFAFIYNNEYIKDLIKKGWKPVSEEDSSIITKKVK